MIKLNIILFSINRWTTWGAATNRAQTASNPSCCLLMMSEPKKRKINRQIKKNNWLLNQLWIESFYSFLSICLVPLRIIFWVLFIETLFSAVPFLFSFHAIYFCCWFVCFDVLTRKPSHPPYYNAPTLEL